MPMIGSAWAVIEIEEKNDVIKITRDETANDLKNLVAKIFE